MSTTERIRGHALQCEGAPFGESGVGFIAWPLDSGGQFSRMGRLNSTSGVGFALCECGAHGPVTGSSNARKQWHRDHKAAAAGGSGDTP